MKKVTAASIALALMASTSVAAQTVKYDTTIAKAAAAKAAEKLGKIRGSIDYDQVPDMVTLETLKAQDNKVSSIPDYNIPTEPKEDTLLSITSIFPSLDKTVTGSIQTRKSSIKRKVIWEKFDRYGNPIE